MLSRADIRPQPDLWRPTTGRRSVKIMKNPALVKKFYIICSMLTITSEKYHKLGTSVWRIFQRILQRVDLATIIYVLWLDYIVYKHKP